MNTPTEMICAVVQVATQAPGVLHQVIIDAAKVKRLNAGPTGMDLIRLGDYPGDEYVGWQRLQNISIIVVLGHADVVDKRVVVTPHAT